MVLQVKSQESRAKSQDNFKNDIPDPDSWLLVLDSWLYSQANCLKYIWIVFSNP